MRLNAANMVTFAIALSAVLLAGCGKQDDPVTQAAKKDVASGFPAPSIAEVTKIAEEGFIYGLPIVMNYGVMYEYIIDKNSGQFKAPFNQIFNEARVFTYKDTAIITPNSDTPYSLLWMDLRAQIMAKLEVGSAAELGRLAERLQNLSG